MTVRDYSAWMWSAYNYWCSPKHELNCNNSTKWINTTHHHRSPEIFHSLISKSLPDAILLNSTLSSRIPPSVSLLSFIFGNQTCTHANYAFTDYLRYLWTFIPVENTLVISSEMLSENPKQIVDLLQQYVGLQTKYFNVKVFDSVRYNTNTMVGSKGKQAAYSHTQGVYKASRYKPLMDETKQAMDSCWCADCQMISMITHYNYTCCNQLTVQEQQESGKVDQRRTLTADPLQNDYNEKKLTVPNQYSSALRAYMSSKVSFASSSWLSAADTSTASVATSSVPFLQRPKSDCQIRENVLMEYTTVDSLYTLSPSNDLNNEQWRSVARRWNTFNCDDEVSTNTGGVGRRTKNSSADGPSWDQNRCQGSPLITSFSLLNLDGDSSETVASENSNNEDNMKGEHSEVRIIRYRKVMLIISSNMKDLLYIEQVMRYAFGQEQHHHVASGKNGGSTSTFSPTVFKFLPVSYMLTHELSQEPNSASAAKIDTPKVRKFDICNKHIQSKKYNSNSKRGKKKNVNLHSGQSELFLFVTPDDLDLHPITKELRLKPDRVKLTCDDSSYWMFHDSPDSSFSGSERQRKVESVVEYKLGINKIVIVEPNPLVALWDSMLRMETSRDKTNPIEEKFGYSFVDLLFPHNSSSAGPLNLNLLDPIDYAVHNHIQSMDTEMWTKKLLELVASKKLVTPRRNNKQSDKDIDVSKIAGNNRILDSVLSSSNYDYIGKRFSSYSEELIKFLIDTGGRHAANMYLDKLLVILSSFHLNPLGYNKVVQQTYQKSLPKNNNDVQESERFFFQTLLEHWITANAIPLTIPLMRKIDTLSSRGIECARLHIRNERIYMAAAMSSSPHRRNVSTSASSNLERGGKSAEESIVGSDHRSLFTMRSVFHALSSTPTASSVIVGNKGSEGTNADMQYTSLSLYDERLVNPFLHNQFKFIDSGFYCRLLQAMAIFFEFSNSGGAKISITVPMNPQQKFFTFLTASFSSTHLVVVSENEMKISVSRKELYLHCTNTNFQSSGGSNKLNKKKQSSAAAVISHDAIFNGIISAMNQAMAKSNKPIPNGIFLDYASRDYRQHSIALSTGDRNYDRQQLSHQHSKLLDDLCAAQFGAKDFYRAAIVPTLTGNHVDTGKGRAGALVSSSNSTSVSGNKLTRKRGQLFTLVSRYLGENIHVRYILEYSTGYYTSMMNLDSHVVTFTVSSILNTTIHPNNIPMCTSSDGNESEAIRSFLVQTDMKHIRLNLDIVSEGEVTEGRKNKHQLKVDSTTPEEPPSQTIPLDRNENGLARLIENDDDIIEEPSSPAPNINDNKDAIPSTSTKVKERTIMDAYIKPVRFHRSLVCNPQKHNSKYSSLRSKFAIDRLLVLYHDPFYSMWSQLYSKSKFQQYLRQTLSQQDGPISRYRSLVEGENASRKMPKWQEFIMMQIISELSNALSVLSPLHMPLFDGKFRGNFADKPVPSFPGRQALVFSYESIIYSLIPHVDSSCTPIGANSTKNVEVGASDAKPKFLWNSLCNPPSEKSDQPNFEKNPFHKIMRYVERYIDLDIASRVPMIGQTSDLAETLLAAEKWREKKGMSNIARSLSDEELVSRGQCSYAMLLTHKDLPSRFKLVQLEDELRSMKEFYHRHPSFICEVYDILESKLPLLYQHMIMIFDKDDLHEACSKK